MAELQMDLAALRNHKSFKVRAADIQCNVGLGRMETAAVIVNADSDGLRIETFVNGECTSSDFKRWEDVVREAWGR